MMASVSTPRWLSAIELCEQPLRRGLDADGRPTSPVAVVDLTALGNEPGHDLVMRLTRAAAARETIALGCSAIDQLDALRPLLEALTVTLVHDGRNGGLPPTCVGCDEPTAAALAAGEIVHRAPSAALMLDGLLTASATLPVTKGLFAESSAYSTLLAGDEFAVWRTAHPPRDDPGPTGPAALLSRVDADLTITLNRPERHNAFSRWVRDAVCEGLDLALTDSSIEQVTLCGAGPSFCSGGDLDEFGSQRDVVAAHHIRLERSVGARLHRLDPRTVAEVHGACIGAGMELAAFTDQVRARAGTWFALPELSMGLIPGAGGTVSLPRRIGRWRTAWLAMSGTQLDLATAVAWGMVDDVVEP
jgi:hypothetical protein